MVALLAYCFVLGLLHGVLPDEHTWPITFSYAIGSGSGWQGMRAGIYFSGGFTAQRILMSEVSYLALAPFLNSPAVDSVVYVIVGVVMAAAGWILLRRQRYPHLHLFGRHHEAVSIPPKLGHSVGGGEQAMPVGWATIHGFIAGFGFGAFTIFVNAVAAPAMPNAWLGFVPGLLFGLGTLVTLAIIGALFPLGLRLMSGLREEDARRFGARVGATTLFAGGLLFVAGGLAMVLGVGRYVPINFGYVLIVLLVVAVAIPAFIHAWRELKASQPSDEVEYSRLAEP
ncbi:MAG: hypothetical protein ACREQ4_18710 [Candidatus Binataceae bacterium]